MRILLINLLIALNTVFLVAQISQPPYGKLFDDTQLHKIDILIDTSSLDKMLIDLNSDVEHPATFIIHYANHTDTIKNIG